MALHIKPSWDRALVEAVAEKEIQMGRSSLAGTARYRGELDGEPDCITEFDMGMLVTGNKKLMERSVEKVNEHLASCVTCRRKREELAGVFDRFMSGVSRDWEKSGQGRRGRGIGARVMRQVR